MSSNDYRKCAKCGRTRVEDMSVSYHRFPNPGINNMVKALAWAKYCWPDKDWSYENLLSLHTTNRVLCGRHFASSQFYDNNRQKLSKFAVPETIEVIKLINDNGNMLKKIPTSTVEETLVEASAASSSKCSQNQYSGENPNLSKPTVAGQRDCQHWDGTCCIIISDFYKLYQFYCSAIVANT